LLSVCVWRVKTKLITFSQLFHQEYHIIAIQVLPRLALSENCESSFVKLGPNPMRNGGVERGVKKRGRKKKKKRMRKRKERGKNDKLLPLFVPGSATLPFRAL